MTAKELANDLRFHVAVAACALFGAYVLAGPSGLIGIALGLVATAFSLGALWQVIRLTGQVAATSHARAGTFIVVLAFFVKVPLFLWLGSHAQRLGGPAPTCFLLGLALVYSLMVGWALAQA